MGILRELTKWAGFAAALAGAVLAADPASAILAKSVAAYRENEPKQRNWNWQTVETRELVDRSGKSTQTFPSLTSESIIRADGRRCNAVVAWGDGRKPYLAEADPEERCQAMAAIGTPFAPAGLLLSQRGKVVPGPAGVVTIAAEPDK